MNKQTSLVELVRRRAGEMPAARAYTFLADDETEAGQLSYAELDRRARTIAAHLQTICRPGDRAMLLYPAGLEYIAAFLGCLYARVVAVPAYPPARPRSLGRLKSIAADAQASCALTTSSLLRTLEGWKIQQVATDRLGETLAEDWQEPETGPDTLAFLQYTSGSTGQPKGVMVTHGNLLHNEQMMAETFGHTEQTCIAGWLPPYHDMGLIGTVLHPLYLGVPCVLMAPMTFLQQPVRWLRTITRYGVTTSGGPNFAYELCTRKITAEQREGLDLRSWRVAVNGAEPVRTETMERFAAMFTDCGFRREAFFPCYGLAEATLLVSGGGWAGGEQRVVSCGPAAGKQQVMVVDPETRLACAPGQVGEVWVAGPSVAKGYWRQPEATARAFAATLAGSGAGPFLRTGDLGYLQEGNVHVTGRSKDLIIIRGRNHYPHDLELTAERSHTALRQGGGAAFSIEVEGEERVVIVQEVERQALKALDVDAVAQAIKRAVAAEHEVPVHEVALLMPGRLPKTSSGKVQRHACREAFLAGRMEMAGRRVFGVGAELEPGSELEALQALGQEARLAAVEMLLRKLVAAGLRVDTADVDCEQPLSSLGLDSLTAVELQHRIASRLGVELAMDAAFPEMTIAELAVKVAGQSEAPPGSRRRLEVEPAERDLFVKCRGNGGYFGAYRVKRDRYFTHPVLEGAPGARMRFQGKEVVVWSLNNYLGLASNPDVMAAARDAVETYGASMPMGSRLLTGNTPSHDLLEERLARFCQKQSAVVFNYGYQGVLGTMASLIKKPDVVLIDSLAHACIVDGAVLASAGRAFQVFRHNDMESLEEQLRAARQSNAGGILIATEGVFGMSGDLAPLDEICRLARQYEARVFVDDAHGCGVMGPTGQGTGEHFQVQSQIDLYFGTFAKAFAAIGGFTAGDEAVVDYIRYNARPHVFAKSLPMVFVAAVTAALDQVERGGALRRKMWNIARQLQKGLVELGFDIGNTQSPITPVYVPAGDEPTALAMMRMLREEYGVFVSGVTYPVVPPGILLLRMTPTAAHSPEDVEHTLAAFRAMRDRLHVSPARPTPRVPAVEAAAKPVPAAAAANPMHRPRVVSAVSVR